MQIYYDRNRWRAMSVVKVNKLGISELQYTDKQIQTHRIGTTVTYCRLKLITRL